MHTIQVIGFRAPFLQPGGDEQFQTLSQNGFYYDTTLLEHDFTDPPMYPYTHEWVKSTKCVVPPCPDQFSYPGLWQLPVIPWRSPDDTMAFGYVSVTFTFAAIIVEVLMNGRVFLYSFLSFPYCNISMF